MTTVAIAIITAMITSGLMIWLFAPKPKAGDFSTFEHHPEHSSTGVIPIVSYSSTNPLECDVCGFEAQTVTGLKIHKGHKHKV